MEKTIKSYITYMFFNRHVRMERQGLIEYVNELVLSGIWTVNFIDGFVSASNEKENISIKADYVDCIQIKEY